MVSKSQQQRARMARRHHQGKPRGHRAFLGTIASRDLIETQAVDATLIDWVAGSDQREGPVFSNADNLSGAIRSAPDPATPSGRPPTRRRSQS